jgi:hypothetical protein
MPKELHVLGAAVMIITTLLGGLVMNDRWKATRDGTPTAQSAQMVSAGPHIGR